MARLMSTIIFALMLALILIEYIYSQIKRDGVYERQHTITNIWTMCLVQLRALFVTPYYLPFLFGIVAAIAPPVQGMPVTPLTFIACYVVMDFMKYAFHRMQHAVGFFWMTHFIHHSDERVDVSTSLRTSPIDVLYQFVFYIPVYLVGFPLSLIFTCFVTTTVVEMFLHDPYVKYPAFLEWVFFTPQTHRVHHGTRMEHQMSNFGGTLSIWDRIFGTYQGPVESLTYGIEGYRESNFIKIQIDPIIAYVRSFRSKPATKTDENVA